MKARLPIGSIGAYVGRSTSTGRLLTRARAKTGLRQKDIASRLGWATGNIMHVETGRRGIAGSEVLAFAREYKCDPIALLKALERDRKAGTLPTRRKK